MGSEKILSREEMDALLAAASVPAGDQRPLSVSQRSVKPYDFKRPRLLTSQHLKTIERMHQEFTDEVGAELAARFTVPVKQVFVGNSEPSFQEHLASMPAGTVLYQCLLEPGAHVAMLSLSRDLAFSMVDRLLGGDGTVGHADRSLTEIERGVLGIFADLWLLKYRTPWAIRIPGFSLKVSAPIPDPNRPPKEIASMLENVCLCASFELKIGTQIGTISVAIPQVALKPFIAALCKGSPSSSSSSESTIGIEHLGEVRLPVSAMIGDVRIRMEEFIKLQPGDVIAIGDLETPVQVYVGGVRRFSARVGKVRDLLAVQVTAVHDAA